MAEVKRGYRKVTAIIPVAVYELLRQQADANDREVGQQAAFLLRRVITLDTRMAEATNGEVVDWMAPTTGPNKDGVEPVVVPTVE